MPTVAHASVSGDYDARRKRGSELRGRVATIKETSGLSTWFSHLDLEGREVVRVRESNLCYAPAVQVRDIWINFRGQHDFEIGTRARVV